MSLCRNILDIYELRFQNYNLDLFMEKIAIIDMGTNTFHLLVAQIEGRNYKIVLEERLAVGIGVGGINQGVITKAGMDRATDAIRQFKNKIDQLGVHKALAFGTSALRNAKNGNDFISKIKAIGIEGRILSGDEEALYIYEGVNLALKLGTEKSLIIDIGGGSVELIIGNGKEIFWKQSFEIGGQRLLERFQKHDPIIPSEIKSLNYYFNETLAPLKEAMRTHSPTILVGSSGTFDTLSDIYCLQKGIAVSSQPETPFGIEAFDAIYQKIISKDRAARMQIPGMIELRVDMIVVTCCLINFILTQFVFERIRVSSYSLKEGVLAILLKNQV